MRKLILLMLLLICVSFACAESSLLTGLNQSFSATGTWYATNIIGGEPLKVWSGDPSLNGTGDCGLNGECIWCDGDDSIKLNGSLPTGPVTFSFWSRASILGNDDYLMRSDSGGNKDFSFFIEVGTPNFVFRTEGGNTIKTTEIEYATWHNYIAVYTSEGMRLYVDGVLAGSSVGGLGASITWQNPIALCSIQSGTANFYSGEIEEINIWSKNLTLTEVAIVSAGNSGSFYPFVDSTPPVTSTYNNTGGINPGNQTAWVDVGTSEESRTEDDTPTITLITDDTSNCSIGLSDLNVSDMVPTYGNLCATSETTSHSCTLNETFALKQGNQPLYISCQSEGGENATSSSGALNITLGFKSISGFIKDASGNALIDATVIAVKQETKKSFNTTTSADGSYSMFVYKGNYSVLAYNATSTTEADVKSYIVVE